MNTRTKSIIGILIVAAIAISGYFVLQNLTNEDDEGPPIITIGTFSKAVDYAPLYVADHFGWLGIKGQDYRLQEFNDLAVIRQSLSSGKLQVVLAAMPPLAILKSGGQGLSIYEVSCTLQQEIVVRSNLAISSAIDLRGQTLAVLKGTSSHYGVLKTLELASIAPSEVGFIFTGPVEAKAMFENDRVSAWAVWPPFVEEQQVSGKGRTLLGGGAVIQSVVSASRKFTVSDPKGAKSVMNAIRRAKVWMLDNPREAQSIVARKLALDPEIVELAWSKHDWGARLDESLTADVQAKLAFLASQGLLDKSVEETKAGFLDISLGGRAPLGR